MADVPDVFIPAVDFFGRLGNGNVVGFGILDQFLPGRKIPGTPGSDDFQGRIEGLDGGLEPDLIIALAGTAVGNRGGPFFFGDFHQLLGHQRTGHGGTQQIVVFINGSGFQGGPDEIGDEFFLDIDDVGFGCTGGISLFLDGFVVFFLASVEADGDDLAVILFLEPGQDDGGVQTSGIG